MQAQTPQQRRANEAFAKSETRKRGKPTQETVVKKQAPQKSPVSPVWLGEIYFYYFLEEEEKEMG